jgi:hypothetical protein
VSRARQLARPVLAAAVALVILLGVRPLSTSRTLAIWIVLVTAIALLVLVRHSRGSAGRQGAGRFEAALRSSAAPAGEQPVELLRVENMLELGTAFAGQAHHRLLPLLRTVAAARLSARHGIELDRRPEAARALLGEEAWDLLRPDRPEPADRFGSGVPRARITAVVDRVESL